MSALTIERRKSRRSDGTQVGAPDCSSGCRLKSGMPKVSTHDAWLLGHKLPLCKVCASEWPEIWERALAGFPDETAGRAAA